LRTLYGRQSDQGRVRTSNEDSYVVNGNAGLFLVADGMGGHAAGEVASKEAAETIERVVLSSDDKADPEELLRNAVESANLRVYEKQRQRSDYGGMGSTLTALLFRDGKYYVAHVGDSRAYLWRDRTLSQITKDHSVVWHLFENSLLRKEDLCRHPQKNLITRSIGPHPDVESDLESGEIRESDVYMLCSDGLTDVLPDEAISGILAQPDRTPQDLADTLVASANAGGGPDNVTVVVVRIEPDDALDDTKPGALS
jgi:serine/threonine protein phosphatase PrpC